MSSGFFLVALFCEFVGSFIPGVAFYPTEGGLDRSSGQVVSSGESGQSWWLLTVKSLRFTGFQWIDRSTASNVVGWVTSR
jgi:hypothetical protein